MTTERLILDPGRYFSDRLRQTGIASLIKVADLLGLSLAKDRLRNTANLLTAQNQDPSAKLVNTESFVQGGSLVLYAVRFVPSQIGRNDAFRLVTAFGNDSSPLMPTNIDIADSNDAMTRIIDSARLETPSVAPFLTAIETSANQIDQNIGQQIQFTQAGASITSLALNDLYKNRKF